MPTDTAHSRHHPPLRQGARRQRRQPARECTGRGRAPGLVGRHRTPRRTTTRRGADRRRRPQLHRRGRHPRIRPAAAAACAARRVQPHRGLQQAGDRRAARRGAGWWAGSGAGSALPAGLERRQARPARGAARPDARRRRHATRAAPDRREPAARADAERQTIVGGARSRARRSAWWTGWAAATTRWPKAWPMRRSCSHRPARRCAVCATRRAWPIVKPPLPRSTRARRRETPKAAGCSRRSRSWKRSKPRWTARSTRACAWSARCSCSASTARSAPA
jgi:hypothetical protein